MAPFSTETFFRPDETGRNATTLPANLYNRCRLLLSRSGMAPVFVPIRNMQYLAVIDATEIIFVDSQAYAVRDGEGGRMIVLAWQFRPELRPDSLAEPVPVEVVGYRADAEQIHRRLQGEFNRALDVLEAHAARDGGEARPIKVLPFRRLD